MAKYKIAIRLIETYENKVVVEAADLNEAIKKVKEEWESDTYLYEDTSDMMEEQDVKFYKCGLASDTDTEHCINID